MSYLSQVTLVVPKDILDTEGHLLKDALKICDSITLVKDTYYVQWDRIVWYEDDPKVQKVNEFMSNHFEEIYFLRIGEDLNDLEDFGHNPQNITILRQVNCPKGKNLKLKDILKPNSVKFILEDKKK